MTYTKGRPTIYKGIRMRSRLEASFAAWLDSGGGATWAYEPQCFADVTGQYLPDFRVEIDGGHGYFEVKPPTADTSAALRKMHIIRSSEPTATLVVAVPTGSYPHQHWVFAGRCTTGTNCAHCRGTTFQDERTIPSKERAAVGGYLKCSQEETDAFLADRPWPRP